MALQPIDRMRGKQFSKTANRKIPSLVVRSNKTLMPSLMSPNDPKQRYFIRDWCWHY